jgi:hypothetical protein
MAYARQMDAWGLDGCLSRYNEIAAHLVSQANRRWFLRLFPDSQKSAKAKEWLDESIRRVVDSELERMSIVWVYWAAGAEGDELRYSMRSAAENVVDAKNFVLCGDKPEWYQGDFIDSPRFNKKLAKRKYGTSRWAKWVDSIVKLQKIVNSPAVTERFLWMYDDTFIVKKTTIEQLSVPRSGGRLYSGDPDKQNRHAWRECQRRTFNALKNHGLPSLNFSTHYPVVYEKSKLRETFERFRPIDCPRLIESLYLNQHGSNPRKIGGEFQYNKKIDENWKVNSSAVVVNVGGFKPPVARVIGSMFSEPCHAEG